MARRQRREEPEEHVNHERWLVTYADMITLLMVLFIVLFAISQVDQHRFDELKDGMAAGFGASATPLEGEKSILDSPGTQAIAAIQPQVEGANPITPDPKAGAQQAAQQPANDAAQAAYDEARRELDRLEKLRRLIHTELARHGFAADVKLDVDARGLRISMISKHIVFAANMAALTGRGRDLLDVLAPVLRDLHNQIEVDGHTNQVKVKPKYYPTDWELSAARAVTVLRYLNEHGRLPAHRMMAAAFGHERPIVAPSLPRAKELNKRVDIIVVSGASEAARNLFAAVRAEGTPG